MAANRRGDSERLAAWRRDWERIAFRRGAWRVAFTFVVLTLAALVVIPQVVERRVAAYRAEVDAAVPARTYVMRLRYNLVREIGAMRELQLSGDPRETEVYADARATERAIHRELAPLLARLGPEVVERYVAARVVTERWHARVGEHWAQAQAEEAGEAARRAVLTGERDLFEQAIRSWAAVDSAIVVVTEEARERMEAAARLGGTLSLVSGFLALLAAGAVGLLAEQARRLAAEAERRRREADAALAETARAVEARTRLLRGVTHDVKNPLGAAKGYAELLSMGVKGPLTPEQERLVQGVERSVDSALAILTDLLDVARADSHGLSVQREPVELGALVREAVEAQTGAAEAAGHEIGVEVPEGGIEVSTDAMRVRQVLDNLLSNAVKYTPAPGRIEVGVAAVGDGRAPRPGRWARVRVSDTGPGIAPEDRERIFEEFTRLDSARGTEGHGLGLAIARRIARLLGGELEVADTPGPGASFDLWLPIDRRSRVDRRKGGGEAGQSRR